MDWNTLSDFTDRQSQHLLTCCVPNELPWLSAVRESAQEIQFNPEWIYERGAISCILLESTDKESLELQSWAADWLDNVALCIQRCNLFRRSDSAELPSDALEL